MVLPGRAYGPELPVLRYPAAALAQAGADVRVVKYSRLDDPGFTSTAVESLTSLLAGATRVTLIGKSLGTTVMAALPDDVPPVPTDAIWLTPIFGDPAVRGGAMAKPWRSLYVYGTADPMHDPNGQSQVSDVTGGAEVAIAGGDHGLEVDGDVVATVEAMVRLTRAVLDFVAGA